MTKVVGFGDLLLRLNPQGHLRFLQADSFCAHYTGAEANVLVSLRMLGMEAELVTRLPDNDIARCALAQLHRYQVGTRHVATGGGRIGLFYVEKGAAQRPSKVVYDRDGSSFATATPGDFDWDAILDGAQYLHFTGITPALGGHLPEICAQAVAAARRHGTLVSCDLNYRRNLWTTEEAKRVMTGLLDQVDIIVANEEDCEKVLGIRAAESDVTAGRLSPDGYAQVARTLCERFALRCAAITLRRSISASDNEWGAMLYADGAAYFSRQYPIHIVDRVGGGDSFAAGLLYAHAQGYAPQEMIEFAAAASCLKHSIELDFNLSTVEEITRLMEGDGSGRVLR